MEDNILLPPVRDCMFKAIMLNPELVDVLKELINIITDIPLSVLQNIKVENTEHIIANKNDKKMISDVIVSVGNKYINVEMNNNYYKGVFNKNDAYLSKLKSTTYNQSEDYIDAYQVIQINFNNFDHFEHKKDIYKFMFREETTNEVDEDSTIKYHVSLQNVWERCYNKKVSELTRFERFCLILKTDKKEYARKLAGDDKVMGNLVDEIAKLSLDNKMIGLYDAEVEAEKVRKTMLKGARLEGLEQGLEQGIEQGIEKGRTSANINTILKLHEKDMPVKEIAEIVDMQVEEVEKIISSSAENIK